MDANNTARLGKLVLRVALANLPLDKEKESGDLVRLLAANKTRDAVYESCVVVINDDPERRKPLYQFMLLVLPGFPPSRDMLSRIDDMVQRDMVERGVDARVQLDLAEVVKQQLAQQPFADVLNSATTFNLEHADIDSRAHYLDMYGLQLLACRRDRANLCAFKEQSGAGLRVDLRAIKASDVAIDSKTVVALPCTDYVNQMPLECTRRTVDQQLDVLENLWDASTQNVDVVRATLFLAKQMCDGFAAKLVFGPPYHLFRSVSVCYLPMLLKWMGSDYMYVRKNVYDFLLTLSLHFQLVDTRGKYRGCSEALQNELLWLLFNVLRRQALTVPYDQMTWSAAAKCTLAIVPRCYRHLVDVRALRQFLLLPDLAECHPGTFGVLVEAFARSLLSDKRVGVRADENLGLDEEEFAKLGSSALSDILSLYRRSTTVLARSSLFHLLFAYATHRMQASCSDAAAPVHSRRLVRDAFHALVQLDFPWYMHSLILYQSGRTAGRLHQTVASHLQNTDLYECHAEVSEVVRIISGVIAEDAQLSSVTADVTTRDVLAVIPPLLKQDTDTRLYSMGWRLALFCARRAAASSQQSHQRARDELTELAECLASCPGASGEAEKALVRRLCPDLLGSLLVFGRSNPRQLGETLTTLLETYLFSPESRLSVPCLMTLYQHILESLTMRRGSISEQSGADWDISELLERGIVVCPIHAMASVGSRVLWALYVGLRGDQSRAVCRARHVLASLLTTVGQCSSVRIWQYVKTDPFSPVAHIGSEKVDALAKLVTI